VALTLDPVRFGFESFATTAFAFGRTVLVGVRATRVFVVDLAFTACFRAPDEDVTFEPRFDLGFALEAEAVFFVFAFTVFFDLVRAAIVNLSTRRLYRTRSKSRTNVTPHPRTNAALRNGKLTFRR
jgi:hypothetical protein